MVFTPEEHWQSLRAEGRLEDRAASLLELLELRGLEVSATERERIAACSDFELLRIWFRRAAVATGLDEIFAEDVPIPQGTPGDAWDPDHSLLQSKTWQRLLLGGYSDTELKAFAEAYREGRIEGGVASVLRILDVRGLEVTTTDRERVAACTDLTLLENWVGRAAVANTTQEVFAEGDGTA